MQHRSCGGIHRSCGDIKLDLCLVHRCRCLVTLADTQRASNPEFKKDLFAAGLFLSAIYSRKKILCGRPK